MVVLFSFHLKIENVQIFSRETLSARGGRIARPKFLIFHTLAVLELVNNP